MTHPRERYRIDVEAQPDEVPPATRLKMFLKRALRSARFRCLRIAALPDDDAGKTTTDPTESGR